MVKNINNKISGEYQLLILGIELVHKILVLKDCSESLANNPHVASACEIANEWNETFIKFFISPVISGDKKLWILKIIQMSMEWL